MRRLQFLIAIVLAIFAASAQAQQPRKPNIVLILLDDMGWGDLSCYDKAAPPTPRIDRLAREGIRFTQFYVTSPICSPSRCSIITGQQPQRWRIGSYLGGSKANENRGIANWLDVKAPSLARSLKDAGYATGHFGKWHLGGGRDIGDAPLITEYGFDKTLTQIEGLGDRLLPVFDKHDGSPTTQMPLGVQSEKLGHGKIEWVDRSIMTTRFADRAIDFIDRANAAGKPFYVNLWPDDVHSPFFPPKELRTSEAKRALYRSVVRATDQQLTKLLDHLAETPALRDNTIVILMSDNGPEPGAGSAGPFRGTKTNLWEGGIREPLIVWAPGFIDANATGAVDRQSILSSLDLAPTIAAITGAAASPGDGQNAAKALLGRQPLANRDAPLFWRRPPDRPGSVEKPFPDLAVREGDWKLLCMFDGSSPQLYDLAHDVGEAKNLAEKDPARVEKMRKQLLAWNVTLPTDKPQQPTTAPAGDGG
jgi:arylsulfatase A-like enzyme